jgi:hypothetical protein
LQKVKQNIKPKQKEPGKKQRKNFLNRRNESIS